MRGNCGQKSIISPPLPCAVDEEPAKEPDSQEFRKALVDVCGATYASGPVCCEAEQVDYLKANLDQVEPLISSCPACRNNFRALFCALTCDPNQADFLKVLETQDLTKKGGSGWGSVSKATASQWSSNSTGLEAAEGHKRYGEAVKEVNFYVGHTFRTAFFDSCKDVQFGAGNSFAMDLIGGGATDADGFLKFLGDEKPLGSPFQLNFPRAPAGGQHDAPNTPDENGRTPVQKPISPTGSASSKAAGKRVQNSSHSNTTVAINPFNSSPRHCGDPDLLSRCACIDCPEVCAALPPVSLPPSKAESRGQTCHVGPFSCFTFVVSLVYILGVLVFSMGVLAGVKSPKGAFRTIQRRLGLFGASSGDGDGDGTAGGRNKRRRGIRHRNSGISVVSEGSGYERVRLDSEEFDQHGERSGLTSAAGTYGRAPGDRPRPSIGGMGRSQSSSSTRLVGARGLGSAATEDDSVSSAGDLGGRSGLGPYGDFGGPQAALETTQPRSYALSSTLSRFFYKLGLASASNPSLTFAIALALLALANLGWMHFAVETDPVHLWVAKDSESKLRKEYFDENFGPFYRTQQVFVMDATAKQLAGQRPRTSAFDLDAVAHGRGGDNITSYLNEVAPALTWERLLWWSDVEAAIRDLKSEPNGLTFQDVCFAPSGPGGPCVVQSILGYFGNDPVGAGLDAQTWADQLDNCARQPGDCLPEFGQPLKRNIVLGGIPSVTPKSGDSEGTQRGRPRDARAVVTTWVVSNSLNESAVERAAEWERTLERFLFSIAGIETAVDGSPIQEHPLGARRRELGLELALSTEVSLEQEIGSSSNTDVGIVVLSYLLMFLYAALTLGGESRSRAVSPPTPSVYGRTGPPGDSVRTGFAGKLLALIPFLGRNRDRSLSSSRKSVFVQSKFLLGLFGIAIVLMSVSSAVGVFSALGVKVTLVIAEVIPFLVLAVGVDNIFLLCNEMDRQTALAASRNASGSHRHSTVSAVPSAGQHEEDSLLAGDDDEMDSFDGDETEITSYGGLSQPHHKVPAAQRAAKALSRIGPSILLSAVTQITSFLLGAIVPMPAVRNFALYAAGSMFIAAVLQCTVFVAAMALDARRVESGRVDCLPCIQYGPTPSQDFESLSVSGAPSALAAEGVLGRFIRKRYAPFLLKRPVKRAVLVLFGALFALSMIGTHHVQMGLDQRLALPSTSYLRSYFDALETYLDVGPPVYFVARTLDATERAGQQALCGRFTTCQELSLANTLEGERKRPDVSFLAEPASSWIDDFLASLNPVLETCCRVKKRDPTQFCRPSDSPYTCRPCFEDRVPPWNITMDGFPEDAEFLRYLQNWLRTPTDENCPLGGQAAYSTALSFKTGDNDSTVQGLEASNFRTYHTPLRSQSDFIDALAASERISADISERTGADVFAYSVFSVFFDQYSHLPATALQVLGGAAIAIFAITTFLLGSWRTGLIVTCCVASALLGVSAMMGVWGIGLNALTLVNLSVCAAISVEFCAHVARAFVRAPAALPSKHPMAQRERDERAWAALVDVGSSVLSGITGTKLVGISVLAFTRSDLLKLYYAKMWFALIILGALHGLVLLPVLLSLYGGRGWATAEDESEVRRRLLRAQDTTEYRPFAVEGGAEEEEGSEDEL
ncbi:niemann-Pick type C- protein 1 [Tilletia horrida]|uniref:Niemann-Pick type C- protein 1 n=1 Tax=Tilletia horrida TaxID=155126 RepID=A0AAN6GRL5_9BASI|nr:niemann-Pick type C- protein 1 [Tilletia horrida]